MLQKLKDIQPLRLDQGWKNLLSSNIVRYQLYKFNCAEICSRQKTNGKK